jgi:hypothetical protein
MWLYIIARSLLAIFATVYRETSDDFWRSYIAEKAKVIWIIFCRLIYAADLAMNNC